MNHLLRTLNGKVNSPCVVMEVWIVVLHLETSRAGSCEDDWEPHTSVIKPLQVLIIPCTS